MKLGGQTVSPETLNQGHEAYTHFCYACHGDKGDGRGPSAPGMRPPPRDFTSGMFKFAGVAAGELPTDAALLEVVRRGLDGTPMLPWDIPEGQRQAIVQYIKTFSERWKAETPGEPIKPDGADPWKGREAEAVAVGQKLYHLSGVEKDAAGNVKGVLAGCNVCHPSYLPKVELDELAKQVLGAPVDLREDPLRPAAKESDYLVGDKKMIFLPTDFLFHRIKVGTDPATLFTTIAAGIGGAGMPQWKGSIPDENLWALVHYVRHLAAQRDTDAGAALVRRLGR
jgi:hypothetical protein